MPEPCVICANNRLSNLPPREDVLRHGGWRAAHAFGTTVPGWLVLVPERHILSLDELTDEEGAVLGPLLKRLSATLREVIGCTKTYVALFAEGDGFEHVHIHVIPRTAELVTTHRGPAVFDLLGGAAPELPEQRRDEIALQLRERLELGGHQRSSVDTLPA